MNDKFLKLWVDDERPAPEGWVWAATYSAAIAVLSTGMVDEISLDHDLGTEKTGYDIGRWLEEQAFHNAPDNLPPVNKIYVHSANSVGRENIQRCIDNFYRFASLNPSD